MLRLLILVAVAFTGLSNGAGVVPDDHLQASVGGKVLFRTNLNPTETPFDPITWQYYLGSEIKPIILSRSIGNLTSPEYEDRITLFISTASLELRNLKLSDSGNYRVTIIEGLDEKLGHTALDIYEPVSDVKVSPLSADLLEFNTSFHLFCSSSGSSLSFFWMNGSSEITASDRVQITNGGSNLTVVNVTRYDQGSYRCNVSNPVSSKISDPVSITVSYGPDNVQIMVTPLNEHHKIGSDISLNCSADSSPSAEILWFLNGDQLPDSGPLLRLMNAQMSQSGNYSCQAFNRKTLRYQTSKASAIFVHEPVSNVKVTPEDVHLNEFNGSISFFCSSSGSSLSFCWIKDGSEVTTSDRVQITDGGSTLTIVNVTRHDNGSYSCDVTNPVSSATSEVYLSVSYGPEKVNLVSSSHKIEEGSTIKLSCSADSRPPATFQWFLNGTVWLGSGSELKLIDVQRNQSGSYSCQAFNSRTLIYKTSQPTVIQIEGSSQKLSPGAIAGIVVACLVVTSVIVFGVYFILKKKKPRGKNITGGNRRDNGANSNEELNYADVKFAKRKKKGQAQQGLDNPSSTYADIRLNNN